MELTEEVLDVKLSYITKQVDRLVSLGEARDAQIVTVLNRLTILEERQSTMSRLMVGMSAAIPTAILGVAKLLGVI